MEGIRVLTQKHLTMLLEDMEVCSNKHTKAKLIDDENYLITLLTYIHQNPVRADLVENIEDWPFSSYRDLAGLRNGTLVNKEIVNSYFNSTAEFKKFSEKAVENIKEKYWI